MYRIFFLTLFCRSFFIFALFTTKKNFFFFCCCCFIHIYLAVYCISSTHNQLLRGKQPKCICSGNEWKPVWLVGVDIVVAVVSACCTIIYWAIVIVIKAVLCFCGLGDIVDSQWTIYLDLLLKKHLFISGGEKEDKEMGKGTSDVNFFFIAFLYMARLLSIRQNNIVRRSKKKKMFLVQL